QANVDLALHVVPLRLLPQPTHQRLERLGLPGRVLEPSEEIEFLGEVPPMVEPPRDGRKVLEPDASVSRSLREHLPSLFLRQVPPVLRFVMGMSAARVASGRPRGCWRATSSPRSATATSPSVLR